MSEPEKTYPITLTRNKGWYGKVRKLMLFADDQKIGEVSSGQTVELQVPVGAREIYGKMDWGKSYPMDLTFVEADDQIYANTWFTVNRLMNLGITKIPCRIEAKPR